MEVIQSSEKIYKIKKNIYESRELYLQRSWFIINNISESSFSIEELIYLSQIWINIKYFKMQYPDNITELINRCKDQVDIIR
jgi:hypothetical protein